MRMNALVSESRPRWRGSRTHRPARAPRPCRRHAPGMLRRAFEEKRHRHLQDMGNLLQAAGADAVGALLVFLHLLEGEAERVAELLLAHAQHHPTHAHPRAHVLVDRIGRLLSHNDLLCDYSWSVMSQITPPSAIRDLPAIDITPSKTSENCLYVFSRFRMVVTSISLRGMATRCRTTCAGHTNTVATQR